MAAEKNTGPWFEELMKLLFKDNPARPLFLSCLLFLFIGYVLYLAACFIPTPHWGQELMIQAMPTVQGLDIEIKWLWNSLYSSSIGSVSFLLIYSVLTSYGLVTSPISFLYAAKKPIDKK